MLTRRIMYLRRRAGMSQAQLAAQLNISASTEGMYKQGRRTPSLEILVRMSSIFSVSLDYLITGSERTPAGALTVPETCPCSTCFWNKYRGQ